VLDGGVMPDFLMVFALIGIVLILSALASGLVVRAPISFPILFLGLGFLLGDQVLGIISIGPHDRILESVATVSLAFVLFLDAVRLRLDELSNDRLARRVGGALEWLTFLVRLVVVGPLVGFEARFAMRRGELEMEGESKSNRRGPKEKSDRAGTRSYRKS
jgi:hypothetical protein